MENVNHEVNEEDIPQLQSIVAQFPCGESFQLQLILSLLTSSYNSLKT